MWETIKPLQFVKEHRDDYLFIKDNRYFIKTYYAGACELSKEMFERYKNWGVRVYE